MWYAIWAIAVLFTVRIVAKSMAKQETNNPNLDK